MQSKTKLSAALDVGLRQIFVVDYELARVTLASPLGSSETVTAKLQ